jgi:hypothetical protein
MTSGVSQPKGNVKQPIRNKRVMAELQDQIAKESASLDLIQKQKQL